VQEILIQAHRSKHSSLEPRALLFGITRHVAYRWIASHQQEQAALAAQQREAADEEPYPSAEDEWQAAERRGVVRASIDELPDQLRDVFVRVEVDEMSMPDAAKDLGIPVNTGYTRLHHARTRFAELLRRLLKRRRIEQGDLAPVALLAASPDADAQRSTVASTQPDPAQAPSTEPPTRSAPKPAHRPTVAPAQRALSSSFSPSWLPHLPWGAAEVLLLGGAVAVSLVVLPPEPDPPAVVAEPEAPTALPAPLSAAPLPPEPQPSPGPLTVTGSSPEPPPSSAPPAPAPVASIVPSAHASSGPSSHTATRDAGPSLPRSDGAWARDIAKLALAGDRAAAAAELAAFRKAYPNSTYITRLESMVAHGPGPASGDAPAPPSTGVPPGD
jgi:RNA polymerase sigma factor (sigma-70 family)